MRKLLKAALLCLCLLPLCGCEGEQSGENNEKVVIDGFEVIVVDSCEYLIKTDDLQVWNMGRGFGYMAHKGNCKFCEERRKHETE